MNRKILTSLIFIGLLSLGLGWGTYSYFSDIEVSEDNIFTAGTIDIAVDGENPWTKTYSIELVDVKPSETREIEFVINNVGTNPVEVWKHIKVTGCDGGAVMDGFEPASSEPEWEAGIPEFQTVGVDAEASWSTAEVKSGFGPNSALLTVPTVPPRVINVDAARVAIPSPVQTIDDLTEDPSVQYYLTADSTTASSPYIILELDKNWDCVSDDWAVSWQDDDVTKEVWNIHVADDWHVVSTGIITYDLAGLKAYVGDALIKKVKVAVGEWTFIGKTSAYVDDLVINAVSYNLEPDLYIEVCHIHKFITYDLYVDEEIIIDPEDGVKVRDVDCYWIYLGTLDPEDEMTVKQSYHLQAEVGNWAQGDRMTFDMEIYAEQLGGPGPTPIWP